MPRLEGGPISVLGSDDDGVVVTHFVAALNMVTVTRAERTIVKINCIEQTRVKKKKKLKIFYW